MKRREFFKWLARKGGALLAIPALLSRCAKNPFTYGLHSSEGPNTSDGTHTHSLSIPCTVLDEAPDTFTIDTSWTYHHYHTLTLTGDQIRQLQAGQELVVETTSDGTHTHTFTIPHVC